jgi:hypothetical protein
MSKVIRCWDDLRPYGIDGLTGEACGYSMRILCDVTEKGKALIERFFGGTIKITLDSNWNGGDKEDPHVGSIMLPYEILPVLGAFCLLQANEPTVFITTLGEAYGWDRGPLGEELEKCYNVRRYYRRSTDPGTGDRNQHAFSGRVE